MTTEQIRIRITQAETKELRDLAARCDLQASDLAALFVRAGLRAMWANGGKVTLPLNMVVSADEMTDYHLNEAKTKGRK